VKALELSREILSKEIVIERSLVRILALFSFVILTALGAYVRIPLPFTPVPITLQTFFVLLSGAALGKRWDPASQVSYLCLGAVGLPVFSGAASGTAYLFGPTGGYLIGFVVSSWIVGVVLQKRRNLTGTLLALALGSLAGIYFFGILGLCLFSKCSFSQGLTWGMLPFIPGDLIKIISAGLIFTKIEQRCREIF